MEQIIREELEKIKEDLIAKHVSLGMKASGKWIESLEVKTQATRGSIIGQAYTYQLQAGRKSGTMPPIQAIEEWIKQKGIKPVEDKMKISSLAFIIARKIKQEGTKYYQQGGTDLIDSVVTPDRIQKIIDRVGSLHVVNLQSEILELIKRTANGN
ncbi:hypothetical protein ACF3OB_01155 [Capnocytophaga canis]|uniref:hypothetical protein n=1 Tax=Capnocytophaga canis TaxID=1848903 RepID=UPI001AC8C139|nr:hypothetical protein [Capnocytophaga canis]GIM60539.1 hypothetical protein CAPN008_05890 [Capnocytophaga canis]